MVSTAPPSLAARSRSRTSTSRPSIRRPRGGAGLCRPAPPFSWTGRLARPCRAGRHHARSACIRAAANSPAVSRRVTDATENPPQSPLSVRPRCDVIPNPHEQWLHPRSLDPSGEPVAATIHADLPKSVFKNRRSRDSADHELDHREVDHPLAGGGQLLVILAETPVLVEPCESPLDYPTAR